MAAKPGGRRRYNRDDDDDMATRVLGFLEAKLSPEDYDSVQSMFESEDEDDAMAADSAGKGTRAAVRAMAEISEAQAVVAPIVGPVLGMDSAGKVYKAALTKLGHDTVGLHPTAARAMWGLLQHQGPKRKPLSSSDAASFDARFPGANSLKLR